MIRWSRSSGPRGLVYTLGRTYPGGAESPSAHQQVAALNTTLPRGPSYTVAVYVPPLGLPGADCVGPVATISRPGIGAGSPCHSQPITPGITSPRRMPVPAWTQCSGAVQIQSAPPVTGPVECAPMSSLP